MFFAKATEALAKAGRTLALRLTLWYAAIFALSSIVAFVLAYGLVASFVAQRTDDELSEDLRDLRVLFDQQGLEGVVREIKLDTHGNDAERVYFRVWSGDGRLLAATDAAAWPELPRAPLLALPAAGQEPRFGRFDRASERNSVRTAIGRIAPDIVLETGHSLAADQAFLDEMLRGFALALACVLVLGGPVGWLIARRALRGVGAVTRAAAEIADGALERRVPVGSRGDELDRLARIFNTMLDRIQALVFGMRDMGDNLAHDLRGPLARMRASAEMSLAGAAASPAHEALAADTIEECDRLLEMLNTTLDIAEADAGAAKLDSGRVDLAEVVRAAAELFQPVAEDSRDELAIDAPSHCWIVGDRQRLQRVVANLVDNALKYTPPGGRVRAALQHHGKQVRLTVEDTGVGIAHEELQRVFQRFYRGDSSRSQRGFGLGLSLARSFVRAHGGEITVSSTPGGGSTFTVELHAELVPAVA